MPIVDHEDVLGVPRVELRHDAVEVRVAFVECRRHANNEIDLVRLHRIEDRVVVRQDAEIDLVDLGASSIIPFVRRQFDAAAAIPAYELERPGSNRCGVVRRLIDVGELGEQMLGQNALGPLLQRRKELRDERRIALLEVDHHRIVVGRVDPGHFFVALAVEDVVPRVHHRAPGERDIARPERRAVVPDHALP